MVSKRQHFAVRAKRFWGDDDADKMTSPKLDRRKFLAAAAIAGAAGTVPRRPPRRTRPRRFRSRSRACLPRCRRMPGSLPPNPGRRRCPPYFGKRTARVRLHGRRHQDARHQIYAGQPGFELPRHPQVADQLRQELDAGIPHLHARGIRRRDVPRLLQGDRQAADDSGPRRRRSAARHHADLQCLVRPRSGHHSRRQRYGCRTSRAGRADLPLRAGHQRHRPRLYEMGRYPGLGTALRGKLCPHVQDRDHAALWSGDDVARWRAANRSGARFRPTALYSEILRRQLRRRPISPR